MPSKIPPCNYQRKTICGYHRRAVAAVKFSPGGTLLGSACEFGFRRRLLSAPRPTASFFFFENEKTRGAGREYSGGLPIVLVESTTYLYSAGEIG